MREKKLICALLFSVTLIGCGSVNKNDEAKLPVIVEEQTVTTVEETTIEVKEEQESETQPVENTIKEYKAIVMSELDKELDLIEIDSTFMKDELSEDITDAKRKQIASSYYKLWDDELNSIWNRIFEVADKEYKNKLLAEQREWIAAKQAASKKAGSSYTDKTLKSVAEAKRSAEFTRLRCYELATCLGSLTGQTVIMPYTDYTGLFVDSQGTNEIYSDMTITKADDGFYEVEIGLYRLATLKGYATLSNGILEFVDESMDSNIKGDIIVEDDCATFTITESDWEYLLVSDIFEFNEKWN